MSREHSEEHEPELAPEELEEQSVTEPGLPAEPMNPDAPVGGEAIQPPPPDT